MAASLRCLLFWEQDMSKKITYLDVIAGKVAKKLRRLESCDAVFARDDAITLLVEECVSSGLIRECDGLAVTMRVRGME